MTTMPHWLWQRTRLTPDRPALEFSGRWWSFAELERFARAWAEVLRSVGVKRETKVALLIRNQPYAVALIHALTYLGAVGVLLNRRLAVGELAFQLGEADVEVVVYDPSQDDQVKALRSRWPGRTWLCAEPQLTAGASPPKTGELSAPPINLDSTQGLMYTSGTSGRPKAVILSYANHWWSAMGSAINLGLSPDDRWLACVPLYHVSGLSILLRSVLYGTAVVLHDGFDASRVNTAIFEQRVTGLSVVAVMLRELLENLGDRRYPPSLRVMLAGGGPVPPTLLEAGQARGVPIYQTYGLTETASQVVTLPPEYALRKLGSAGKPLFPAEVRIGLADDQGVGEIWVRGPNVTPGYYRREEEDRRAFADGWLKTGDLGYIDEEGFLYVLDRRRDLIISGGENVYPAEVESVLMTHPAVRDAGVIGVNHARWGKVPVAVVVVADDGLSAADVKAHCATQLAGYKVPRKVYFADRLPRTASGKLIRRLLHDIVPSAMEGDGADADG